jgi:DNA-binding MarR family transcriptional regulator
MLEKAPDVTRLVDRLEAQGFVERDRSAEDRRLSLTLITKKGLALLDEMKPRFEEIHTYFSERVSRRDARELTRVCEGLYAADE